MIAEQEIMTVEEMAEFLKISRTKAYELCRLVDFPAALRIGRSIRIYKPRLVEWLAVQ